MYFRDVVQVVGYTPLVELAQMSPKTQVRILAMLEGQNLCGQCQAERSGRHIPDRKRRTERGADTRKGDYRGH